jgi:hypothetical protein
MGRHSDALDLLNDTVDWTTSKGGLLFLTARSHWFSSISELFSVDECQRLLIRTLVRAEPFYWDAPLVDVLDYASKSTPLEWRLTDPFLPASNGFMYLANPIQFGEDHGKFSCEVAREMTGFAWRKRDLWVDLVFFANPTPTGYLHLTKLTAEATGERVPPYFYELEQKDLLKLGQHCVDELRKRRALNRAGQPWIIASWKLGQTIRQTLDSMYEQFNGFPDFQNKMEGYCEECSSAYWRVFAAALQFMNQKITIPVHTRADRGTLRRIKDKPEWKAVQVIQLRRVQSQKHPSDIESQAVDWRGYWLVGSHEGGFWRKQYMPATGTHQPRWIMSYMKGNFNGVFIPPKKRHFVVNR